MTKMIKIVCVKWFLWCYFKYSTPPDIYYSLLLLDPLPEKFFLFIMRFDHY